ncbi:MAG: beta-galactosidase [Sedimentisphaeraceae bacterium JB056]
MKKSIEKFSPPYIGAAYYPETWSDDQVDKDIALMKDAGINAVRIAEFSWSILEPSCGKYDFDWIHNVIVKLRDNGIAVILGTPTATPPIWIAKYYPECIAVSENGDFLQHGSRRHFCPNSQVYRQFCKKIVDKMSDELGRYENVIGWQIDNEIYPSKVLGASDRGCYCEVCKTKFRKSLRQKFTTIEELNQQWGTNFWSIRYQDFCQIDPPRPDTWHHPSLLVAWMLFQSQSNIEYCHFQADILKSKVNQPIGTDTITQGGLSHFLMTEKLDVVQQNHYTQPGNMWEAAFWMDLSRGLKDKPFWITETGVSWNGNITMAGGARAQGFSRMNSWLAFALGAEANLYWLWRAHRSGHEMMHGSLLSSSGRPTCAMNEVSVLSKELKECADILNNTRVVSSEVALHFSQFSWWHFKFQPMIDDFDYFKRLIHDFYLPIHSSGIRPDVIQPGKKLDDYKVIFSPFLPNIEEQGLESDIYKWVASGGVWVAGPLTDLRTQNSTAYADCNYGHLEKWLDIYSKYQLPGYPFEQQMEQCNGREFKGAGWYDAFVTDDRDSLVKYTSGQLCGLSSVVKKKLGDGWVIMLGTIPDSQSLGYIIEQSCQLGGVKSYFDNSHNLTVVCRQGVEKKYIIVVETMGKMGWIDMRSKAVSLLTGKTCNGHVDVGQYEVLVLEVEKFNPGKLNVSSYDQHDILNMTNCFEQLQTGSVI